MAATHTIVPAFHDNVSFNAHHSPMGAFCSFTCGHFGTRGGFGLQIGRPGNQDLYVGVKDGDRFSDAPMRCLPFYEGAHEDAAAAFRVEQQRTQDPAHQKKAIAYPRDQIRRHYGWASDRWVTDDFELAIYTPFGSIPDPASASGGLMRQALLPAVTARLVVDNSRGTMTRTAFFAIGFPDRAVRILDPGRGSAGQPRVGFGLRREMGVAAELRDRGAQSGGPPPQPFVFLRWSPSEALRDREHPVHLLGSCPGIGFEVPPGRTYELVLALGCHLDGIVTTRLEGRYFYTRYFASLDDVLGEALDRADELAEHAAARDRELLASGLSPDQQFLVAHATRSYYGSTQLLDVGGQPFWVVNEGEYCMMNTLDLSVDHVFWELRHNPWVVKNLLDNFQRYYSYTDQVKDRKTGGLGPGGISFTHDMGVHNNFSPFGHSSYELANLDAECFSYMTAEQLCNWTLIAACYVANTGDVEWARHNQPVLDACLASLINRGPQTGIIERDSARCGSGAEITTYDSLDHSLAQTRNNVYMAVKAWASYAALLRIDVAVGRDDPARRATIERMMSLTERTLGAQVQPDGHLPAVFEKDNSGFASRILPACEGLVYLWFWGERDRLAEGSPLQQMLKAHTLSLLLDREKRNLFNDGGLKLSSTSNNSWISKIAIVQHVARRVFGLGGDPGITAIFRQADAAHVKWETEGASAYWAMSDQIVSGVAQGSRYYPRCVTSVLWLAR